RTSRGTGRSRVLVLLNRTRTLEPRGPNLLVLTAATEETDGFRRFMRTASQFNYTVTRTGPLFTGNQNRAFVHR
uniref:PLOD1-3-like GT domain-containing protein n=1 Tax=Cyprinodon variegatus TaxID=28743 RepID=A0A3Q2CZ80_CYPVA